ncbi:MAG: thrombospondin type 3 repeat-containing protein, partial [Bacteroidota bacterium]
MIHDAVYQQIGACVDAQVAGLEAHYDAVCGNGDSLKDEFILQYPIDYYHFTLFYYDRAGNLVKTVAPKGVKANPTGTGDPTRMDHPAHTFITESDYNSLGQVTRVRTPDGDTARVWYDQWGRSRFTQNQAQKASLKYSYVKYDYLGRMIETGESGQAGGGAFANAGNINSSSFPATGSEQTFITYTDSSGITYLDGTPQQNLRNRVSLVRTSGGIKTHYSYDVHGNVEWVAQEIPGLVQKNYTHYTYELISGNMQQVDYNDGKIDQFHHRYSYDKDGRLTSLETSRDGRIWDRDAGYTYGATGELRRRELGEDKLAGLDYTYTLQGAPKGVNAPSLKSADDPGQDGTVNTYAPDSFAVALSYYPGDFARSGSVFDSSTATGLRGPPLFDGNISSVTSHIGDTMQLKYSYLNGETYHYDQLGRLKSSTFRPFDSATSTWDTTSQYATSYAYDPNGNIDSLRRNAYSVSGSMAMDSLRYRYVTAGSGEPTNKLDRVQDAVAGKPYTDDISSGQTTGNYTYDANGRLTGDASENAMAITWTHEGKVSQITSTEVVAGTAHHMQMDYLYDGGENCVRKSVTRWIGTGAKTIEHTYYVYGADGNVMAIYQQTCQQSSGAPHRGNGGSMGTRRPTGGGGTPVVKASKKNDRSLLSVDTDGDGIIDSLDNCPNIPNPGQADFDHDG